ncbi:hypothetical protein JZ751_023375, partial [Albula glossodonta]
MGRLACLLCLSCLALRYTAGGDVCVSGHDSGPVFEGQPYNVLFPEGLTDEPLNGTDVPVGEDSRYTLVAGNLLISSPQPARDAGSYQCLATNRCGTVLSQPANLKFG